MSGNENLASVESPLTGAGPIVVDAAGTPSTKVTKNEEREIRTSSSDTILNTLTSTEADHARQRQQIVEAEATLFTATQLIMLRPHLRKFILQFRDSQDRIDQIAVASAIRKLVATMPPEDLSSAGFLLEAGPRSAPPISVELEVAKMIVRKLTANPADLGDASPELGQRLSDIAETYLSDRLLSREKYGATALNAVLGLALIRSTLFEASLRLIRSLHSRWFVDHLAHRSRELIQDLSSRFPSERIAHQVACLRELVAASENFATHDTRSENASSAVGHAGH